LCFLENAKKEKNSEKIMKRMEEASNLVKKKKEKVVNFGKNEEFLYRSERKCVQAKVIRRHSNHVHLVLVNGLQKLAHTNQMKKKIIKTEYHMAVEDLDNLEEGEDIGPRRSERIKKRPD
jgi:hypothetical protein